MFESARLKLTLWYILIAGIITFLFSLLAYNGFRFEFERGLQRQRFFIQNQFDGSPPMIVLRHMDPSISEELKERLIRRILYIDGVVILVAAVGGYLLAGRTLKPIQDMVREQDRFIADASHELRTPLTALRTEMEASLLDPKLTTIEARKIIESNLEEVINLQTLSDNLLRLSHSPHDQKQHFSSVGIKMIVDTAIKRTSSLAKLKRITITAKTAQATIKGDTLLLSELLVLLLDNAIKYSPKNSEITIRGNKVDHSYRLTIKDQGVGIPAKDLPFIFDRFFRSDKSRTQSAKAGYGLGLAIAKKIVGMHKGHISVVSKEKVGTTFTVSLPVK